MTTTLPAAASTTSDDLQPQSDINAMLKADIHAHDIGAPITAPNATSLPEEPTLDPVVPARPPAFKRPPSFSSSQSTTPPMSTSSLTSDFTKASLVAVPAPTNEDLLLHDLKSIAQPHDWVSTQEKTFLRWCNYYLSQRDLKLDSLHAGLSDGHLLNNLLEILSGKRLPRWRQPPCKTQVQRLDNLSIGFSVHAGRGDATGQCPGAGD